MAGWDGAPAGVRLALDLDAINVLAVAVGEDAAHALGPPYPLQHGAGVGLGEYVALQLYKIAFGVRLVVHTALLLIHGLN